MYFAVVILSLLFACIKQNKWFLLKKLYFYHYFFLVPGSRSTFPETDPDPGEWYGSGRIRIRNTAKNDRKYNYLVLILSSSQELKKLRTLTVVIIFSNGQPRIRNFLLFLGKKNILNSIDFIFQPYGILNHAKPKKNIDP